MTLLETAARVREYVGVSQKRDIQVVSHRVPWSVPGPWGSSPVKLGDDCAAIPDGDGYLLLAIEGMSPDFVRASPRAAGFCSVLVNASDVYAMGGRPIAVVDALFSHDAETAGDILKGVHHAAARLAIPVVGGHTNLRSPYDGLAVAIVGRAKALLTSFDAQAGDDVVVAVDLRGKMMPNNPFWDATDAPDARMREDFEVLPTLAEAGLVRAGKDISMGGVAGSLLMLIESSRVGADLLLDRLPRPEGVDLSQWLVSFPSYGFVLAVDPSRSERVMAAFTARGLVAAVVGTVQKEKKLTLCVAGERAVLWDLDETGLTRAKGAFDA